MGESIKEYIKAVLHKWWWLVGGIVGGGLIFLTLTGIKPTISLPVGLGILFICLVIAQFLAFHELHVQKVALAKPTNYIEAYEVKHRKLPELPRELHEIFPQYKLGQPISRDLEAKTPSTQLLRNLSYNQPLVEFLFSMLAWQKKDPRTYVAGSVGRPIVWSGQNPKEWAKDFVSYWQNIINDERRNKEKENKGRGIVF